MLAKQITDDQAVETLQIKISEVTSEHTEHSASELNVYRADGDGWQSAPHPSYPQYIIFHLEVPPGVSKVRLKQLKILTHEYKIPKKIEIYLASDPDKKNVKTGREDIATVPTIGFDQCRSIRRLGYVPLDSNERTNFQARELKSIKVGGAEASFVKLVLHECHENDLNTDNQVGIVAISCLGVLEMKKDNASGSQDSSILECENIKHLHSFGRTQGVSLVEKRKQENAKKSECLDPSVQVRIDNLENMKQKMAECEDFDGAAKVKEELIKVNDIISKLRTIQSDMCRAAADEDYAEASRLKSQRDTTRTSALDALASAERAIQCQSRSKESGNRSNDKHSYNTRSSLDDLSLSTIGGNSASIAMAARSFRDLQSSSSKPAKPFEQSFEDLPIISKRREHELEKENEDEEQGEGDVLHNVDEGEDSDNEDKQDDSSLDNDGGDDGGDDDGDDGGDDDHPLDGIPGFENLSSPEEINFEDGNVSPDLVQRIESIIGSYRTKCLFSKNWSLREAAIAKTSMMIPDIRSKMENLNNFFVVLCSMLVRVLDDRIVQVFITGLILLDDCVVEFEKAEMTQKEAISHLGKIISSLIGKLGDSKSKVVEGAETALISLALSSCIGPAYIAFQIMKQMSAKDAKVGKAITSRLSLLQDLVEEFGDEGPSAHKVMEFVQEYGFRHKDAEVRDAAKSLSTAVYLRDGSDVLSMLDGLSDRQIKEYKASFLAAKRMRSKAAANNNLKKAMHEEYPDNYETQDEFNNESGKEHTIERKDLLGMPSEGRGRGRGRGVTRN